MPESHSMDGRQNPSARPRASGDTYPPDCPGSGRTGGSVAQHHRFNPPLVQR
ncbi:hypothetical protein PGT21_031761 [Puccinia graminis f. sp. tritici]|uniref:Uncharacterized protein n=1 Tax=Puccinia graminis f. sp. tritici TaxID=56615 RepID=A0A5B0MW49_PUCGR|nr:hypothetical protein PGT21_031761 [Puccinia graminis f. sp. tritici]KAA1131394.1 hypothetical protein PGTUg99_033552 [Puccinia graminis f. sp. tritici]